MNLFKIFQSKYNKNIDKIINLIGKEENWCKHALARDINNEITFCDDPNGVKWCLMGAFYKLNLFEESYLYSLRVKANELGYINLVSLNDDNDHSYVINFLKKSKKWI